MVIVLMSICDDVFRIADTYRMHAYPVPNMPDRCIKVLEKKR